ncbi:DUF7504 family protein [Haloparvum sedimenti]|uniref:DUF7504 family protein n=1 Tax=Haloparvum sedimenti TaxID=1678448 RepID=UPI00071E79CE|nr:hypothetical protein [Haloparvum sedimenti]
MESTRRDRARVRQHLARLKRRGCNLLVVGATDAATRRAATRRLFGAPGANRDRVLITVGNVDSDEWLPDGGRVIDAAVDTRSAAALTAPSTPSRSVPEAVDDVASTSDDEPGRFRLGVTALAPLLESPGGAETVASLRETVREARGIGHYHLSAPFDADRTRAAAADFDAVVELRRVAAGPQERWHLEGADLVTPWLPLEE